MPENIYDFNATTIEGKEVSLKKYHHKTLLIVNVASHCGFTSQYSELEALFQKYKAQNFMILGFPCNQFSNQEKGTNQEIQQFCSLTYNVTFDMFAKIDVNGKNALALYEFLKKEKKGLLNTEAIKWNFTKFLVSPEGKVLKRYAPATLPSSIEGDIKNIMTNNTQQ